MPSAGLDLKRELLQRHFLFREFTLAELDELLAYNKEDVFMLREVELALRSRR